MKTSLVSSVVSYRQRLKPCRSHTNIDKRRGQIQTDERKVRQVVLNLFGAFCSGLRILQDPDDPTPVFATIA